MKDSIKLMKIHRDMLELCGDIVEVTEAHYTRLSDPNISKELRLKLEEFQTHSLKITQYLNEDLHLLIHLDKELHELEEKEAHEKT